MPDRSTPDVEVERPDEAEDVAAVREIFAELRAYAFEKHQRVRRPVFDDSTKDRHHLDARTRREPDDIAELPA